MVTVINMTAEDPKVGISLVGLKSLMEQVDAQHVGREVTDVRFTVRTGWKGQIKVIKAEIEHN